MSETTIKWRGTDKDGVQFHGEFDWASLDPTFEDIEESLFEHVSRYVDATTIGVFIPLSSGCAVQAQYVRTEGVWAQKIKEDLYPKWYAYLCGAIVLTLFFLLSVFAYLMGFR